MISRRVAIRSLLGTSSGLGLAVGSLSLAGCGGGERELPVIDSKKPKDDLQREIENPYGPPAKRGKSKLRG